jgi:hypothetical protein
MIRRSSLRAAPLLTTELPGWSGLSVLPESPACLPRIRLRGCQLLPGHRPR